ncbi:coiled coil protein [Legionella sainthelensi]|uniref:Coiled coil protein n=1 Tax=Legionella sainthelensi TaxID=28087 RepID=A0A0W0YIV0_9GAMM|nr:coiled-coil protein [Legionella sainthelensi]KTD56889.1 coiled coil protein [Legionella sainthelensi]VEH37140.1 coiled coil protein [Legionella sainthelensi]
MYFLERLLAIFLGIVVLPLRVFAYHALWAIIAFFVGFFSILGLPLSLALTLHHEGLSKANILLALFFGFPIIAIIVTGALSFLMIFLLCSTIVDTVEALGLGFINSLLYGMDGFWNTLSTQQILSQAVWNPIRVFLGLANTNQLMSNGEDQRIMDGLQNFEIVQEDIEIPDLQNKEPREPPMLLKETELKKIEELIAQLTYVKESLKQPVKEQLTLLNILYIQYKDLFSKLEKVHLALMRHEKSQIKDELIAYNKVKIPILLAKQYKKGENWYHVPAASYVTDRDSFLHLLKYSSKHPLNRDLFKRPRRYNQMETRYIWYELTENYCSSQELSEVVIEIRVVMNALLSQMNEIKRMNVSIDTFSPAFFAPAIKNNEHSLVLKLEQKNRLPL